MKIPVSIKSFSVLVNGGINLVIEIPETEGNCANEIIQWKVQQLPIQMTLEVAEHVLNPQ